MSKSLQRAAEVLRELEIGAQETGGRLLVSRDQMCQAVGAEENACYQEILNILNGDNPEARFFWCGKTDAHQVLGSIY